MDVLGIGTEFSGNSATMDGNLEKAADPELVICHAANRDLAFVWSFSSDVLPDEGRCDVELAFHHGSRVLRVLFEVFQHAMGAHDADQVRIPPNRHRRYRMDADAEQRQEMLTGS